MYMEEWDRPGAAVQARTRAPPRPAAGPRRHGPRTCAWGSADRGAGGWAGRPAGARRPGGRAGNTERDGEEAGGPAKH